MKLIGNEWFWFLDPCKNEFNYRRRDKVKLYATRFNKFKCKYEIAETRVTESARAVCSSVFFAGSVHQSSQSEMWHVEYMSY